ncbi:MULTISPECIES: PTS system mannose/fructose/sorbose family transporter subunit IID [Enterocloster]|uniref:PTS system IID component, Man family n=1 Tax=Enterocloster lavalensis TaxID=460384 RepID=A0A1I0JZC8_9FIRM|nr:MULTISPECIES: PTS system mannose/fructose/sorbose family transporter subunit IID [Enterocloster]MCB6342662.1 PTS system mannose/fructose/sorbose family transporter subunit IID [Enterocloster lavalensis]MDR3757324.1 PTS system mannose/fructose/sorbose family transporter subunit IID [Enterocloster sp.]PST29987.1 PTS mannose transporter subunit IIA [Enterocloster lavalensis]SEU16592.1 PTS system IID component, Man family [Enterocloster lavalensis]
MPEEKKIVLDKKTLRQSWWNWTCWGQICYNFERMMGLGFCHSMIPILKKLYPDDKEKRAEGMSRHLTYYNTENTWGCLIPGIVAAMEEEKANGADVEDDAISNIKTALMGPLAGVGDAITQGIVKVILLAIGIDLAMQGNPLGPILFVLVFSAYALGVGYTCYMTGYKMGKNAVVKILSGGLIKEITEGCGAMGMMVLGGLVATKIGVTTPLSFALGEKVTEVQALIDQIMPALLPLALFFGVYALLRKGMTPMKTMGIIFAAGTVLSLTGILV